MRNIILLLSLIIIAFLLFTLWKGKPKQEVPKGEANLYFFYTDWCGWSKKAMPEWEKLESKLQQNAAFGTTVVKAVRVNAEKDQKTAELYEVEGYPTIKLETSSRLYDYSGPRTAEGLLNFLRDTFGKEGKSL